MKPFLTAVVDYHDFEQVKKHFKHAGFDLDYVEVGCGHSPVWCTGSPVGYHAVFFEKGKKTDAEELIKKWHNHLELLKEENNNFS